MIPEYITLERAVSSFKNSPTPENAQMLRERMMSATYYLYLHPSLLERRNQQAREQALDDAINRRFGSLPLLLLDTHSEAGLILPVFTSRSEAEKSPFPGVQDLIEIGFPELYSLVQSSRHTNNLLLNPEGDAIAFARNQFLDSFVLSQMDVREESEEADCIATFVQGRRDADPTALKTLLHEARRDGSISRLWLTKQMDNGRFVRWFLVVDTDAQRADSHQRLAAQFLQACGRGSAGICYADAPMAADIVARLEPVYRR